MRQPRIIKTTLGDLVPAVTDEVKPFVRDPQSLYTVVSFVVNDVIAHHQLRVRTQARQEYPSHLANTLN